MSDATWAAGRDPIRLIRHAAIAGLAALLVACGGGDAADPAQNTVILPGGVISTPGGGGTDDGGGDPQTSAGSVSVLVIDPGTGQSTNTLAFGTNSTVRATVRDGLGRAVQGALVSFTATGGNDLQFSPASTALTDANGEASISAQPASAGVAGAFAITATSVLGTDTLSATVNVAVGTPPVTLGALSVAQSPLAAYGSTVVSVPVNGVPTTTPIAVRFNSACAQLSPAKATVTSLVTSSGGVARATYTDLGCGATDLITATVEGTNITATGSITVTPPVNTIGLSVIDQSTGLPTNSISLLTLTQLRATVLDASGAPVPNVVVRFDSDGGNAIEFEPAPTALTNANGIATVTVKPASFTTAGAYALTAFTQVDQAIARGTVNVAVGATNVTLGSLSFGQSPLSAYGTTVVSVPIGGVPAGTPVSVRFTSTCAGQSPARAEITEVVATTSNVARATYVDRGCAGDDLVSATVEGTSVVSVATLSVAPPAVSNIQFVDATPQSIAIRGSGGPGLSEVSLVRFRVVDQANNPIVSPVDVTLSLSNNTGGILIDQGPGPVVRQTNAAGEVEVQVQSGTVPTPVWVIAEIDNGGQVLRTNSNVVSISTGQPIQGRFSVSAAILNPELLIYDICEGYFPSGSDNSGPGSFITIIAGDSFGNPVPDGTAVNFISEAGVVDDVCRTNNGVCSVFFCGSDNRPIAGPGQPRSDTGRVTVVPYAVGEEAYLDFNPANPSPQNPTNSNGVRDPGEPFDDLGWVYVDADEDGQYDPSERFVRFNDESSACVDGNVLPNDPLFVPNTCDGEWGLAHVRNSGRLVVVLAGSSAFFKTSPLDPAIGVPPPDVGTVYQFGASCSLTIPFWLQDVNGNPMPFESTIIANVSAGENLDAAVAGESVPNTNARGGTFHVVSVTGTNDETGECDGFGTVVIEVTTPRGNKTALNVTILPQP